MMPPVDLLDIDLIGIPFASKGRDPKTGLDCWGLLRYVYESKLDIMLPSYADEYLDANDRKETLAAINRNLGADWVRVEVPRVGDAVRLRVDGDPCHVAVYIGRGLILHTQAGINSVAEELFGDRWGRRIVGIYRHAKLYRSGL